MFHLPWFIKESASLICANVDNLFTQLSGFSGFPASKITNIVGSAGPNPISQDWFNLQQPAGREEIFTESNSYFDLGIPLGHAITQMTDSMAVYNLLASIGSNLRDGTSANLSEISDLFEASSIDATNSLEAIVNSIIDLFSPIIPPLVTDNLDDRESFYQRIQNSQLTDAIELFQPMTIVSLVGQNVTQLVDQSHQDIAYRYALVNLNPFAIIGDNTIYANHNQNNELELENLTDEYLQDRSQFLQANLTANLNDSINVNVVEDNITYHDIPGNITVHDICRMDKGYLILITPL